MEVDEIVANGPGLDPSPEFTQSACAVAVEYYYPSKIGKLCVA